MLSREEAGVFCEVFERRGVGRQDWQRRLRRGGVEYFPGSTSVGFLCGNTGLLSTTVLVLAPRGGLVACERALEGGWTRVC